MKVKGKSNSKKRALKYFDYPKIKTAIADVETKIK